MFIDKSGNLYQGDLREGDRVATLEEVSAWESSRIPTYADLRRAEYPPIGDQLDALWKGGTDAEAMKSIIDGVKARYPKP